MKDFYQTTMKKRKCDILLFMFSPVIYGTGLDFENLNNFLQFHISTVKCILNEYAQNIILVPNIKKSTNQHLGVYF